MNNTQAFGRNCKTFLKACAVSVQIRQTFFYIKSFFSQNFLQKKPHMFCFFLCTQDNRCCFIFFFAEFQSFCNLFRSMAHICKYFLLHQSTMTFKEFHIFNTRKLICIRRNLYGVTVTLIHNDLVDIPP